jgi:hypothetical protein
LAAAHSAELVQIRERRNRNKAERAAAERADLTAALSDALRPWWRKLLRD